MADLNSRTDRLVEKLRKNALPFIGDATFGLFVAWLVYVYIGYRLEITIFEGEQQLAADSFPTSALNTMIGLLVAYIASKAGKPTAHLAEATLRVVVNALGLHIANIPPKPIEGLQPLVEPTDIPKIAAVTEQAPQAVPRVRSRAVKASTY